MTRLPLEGVRVVDFCVVWAGPFATMLLGDLGAEVIKVENPFIMQPMTRGTRAHIPKQLLAAMSPLQGGFPNSDPGERPFNYSPTFVQLYRNKKSFTVDWQRPEGRDVVARLIAMSDVVIENNATETMEKLGVTYEWARSLRDDIIMVRIPAYGSTGPYANARALGVHLESVMGHTLLRGHRDMDPSSNTAIFSGDYLAGAQAALAVMMAVWHRKKTGRGQLIEIGQAENAAAMLAQAFMDHTLNGRVPGAIGNRSLYGAAPYGVYPCASPGPAAEGGDRWIAITVTDDDEWRALCGLMGEPSWTQAPELSTGEGRSLQQDLLDERLAAWTRDQDDYELFHRLQQAGVPAAPVLEASRVMDDPHVKARGLYEPKSLADGAGTFRFMAPFYRFPETPVRSYQPPVAFGEHNEYVYKELLGFSDAEYEHFERAGHISREFDPSVP